MLTEKPMGLGYTTNLVGGLEHFLFSHILGIIIPTDFHIFQRGSNHQPAILKAKQWQQWGYEIGDIAIFLYSDG